MGSSCSLKELNAVIHPVFAQALAKAFLSRLFSRRNRMALWEKRSPYNEYYLFLVYSLAYHGANFCLFHTS